MTGFDRRLKELLEKVRLRAEAEGLQWRKADKDVYAFRAGPYVITVAKDRDPLLAVYDEHGEELEAIDRADLEGRMGADGKPLAEVKARIWRLARRGSGVSVGALDRVLDWLEERPEDSAAAPDTAADVLKAGAERPAADRNSADVPLQAPQAGLSQAASPQTPALPAGLPQAGLVAPDSTPAEPERREETRNGAGHANGGSHSGPRPPWAQ